MRLFRNACIVTLVLPMLVAGCALSDLPTTPPPPLTLLPPPTLVFSGSCDETRLLEGWLQKSAFTKDSFLKLMEAAAFKRRGEVVEDVARIANLRDNLSALAAPDCSTEPHILLVDALNKAVVGFQAYVNGEIRNVGGVVADAKARLAIVDVYLLELADRLETQYGSQQ